MILTEAEARTKWCPFVRFHGTPSDDNMSNRDGGVDNGNPGMSRCIASGCMAWKQEVGTDPSDSSPFGSDLKPTGRGWCGLATAPHP